VFYFINISISFFAYPFYHTDGCKYKHKCGGISATGEPFYVGRGKDLGQTLGEKNQIILGHREIYLEV
jgi:hypothetical protein